MWNNNKTLVYGQKNNNGEVPVRNCHKNKCGRKFVLC